MNDGKLITLDLLTDLILKYYQNRGLTRGLSAGWPALDEYFLLQKGMLHIVTGIPSSGKSEWLDQLMLNTVACYDWHWTVFSPENWPLPHHFQKLAEKWTGKPMFAFKPTDMTIDKLDITTTISELQQFITFIDPPKESVTIKPILDLLQKSCDEHVTDAFLLDPWNELEHNRPSGMSETEYIGQTLTLIRNFGRKNNVAMFIVAHPTKLQKDDTGNYPVPSPYDISGSAHWRNKADVCIALWRDYQLNDGVVQVHIQKVRNKNLGKLGLVHLYWNRSNGIFYNSQQAEFSYEHGIRNRVGLCGG